MPDSDSYLVLKVLIIFLKKFLLFKRKVNII
jgi:hypothetical protein